MNRRKPTDSPLLAAGEDHSMIFPLPVLHFGKEVKKKCCKKYKKGKPCKRCPKFP